MRGRNDPCWCGSGLKWKKCHYPQTEATPSPDQLREQYNKKYGITLKNKEQIEAIRKACHLTSYILEETCKKAVLGVTTSELNDFAEELHRQHGAIPAALHYGNPPFPKGICTSFNNVICHGIPDDTPLREGDILNIDIASIYQGYYGDCSCMVTIGTLSEERQRVVDVSYECLIEAIAILKPGLPLNAIGNAIETYARAHQCSVVHQFVGHGVGLAFHENPQVPHCYNNNTMPLAPGMIFTIEPMINAGVRDAVIDPINHWTAYTKDGKSSAQWEHTVLITETGYEVLTNWKR